MGTGASAEDKAKAIAGASPEELAAALAGMDEKARKKVAAALYNPQSVAEAWQNHFEAFGSQDLDKIMLDYDEESVLQIYNDGGKDGILKGHLQEFVGVEAIREFFAQLFKALTSSPTLAVPEFSGGDANPVVEGGDVSTANVFLIWSAVPQGIIKATDSFMWKEGFKIKKQNIVASQPDSCPESPAGLAAPTPVDSSPTASAWKNHFEAFGAADVDKIMLDYTEDSVVRVFDWNGEKYSKHTGLAGIRDMFKGLFEAIDAAKQGDDKGVGCPEWFPRVERDSVFLVWKSFSHPKATDTFLFDAGGKITRQNIVVDTSQ